jgi:hypothetical protein
MNATSLKWLLRIAEPYTKLSINGQKTILLMMKMLAESSLLGVKACEGYGLHRGQGVGDLLLRFIMSYL